MPFAGTLTFNISIFCSYNESSSAVLPLVQEKLISEMHAANAKPRDLFLMFMVLNFKFDKGFNVEQKYKKKPHGLYYID